MNINEGAPGDRAFATRPHLEDALLQIATLAGHAFTIADGVGVTVLDGEGHIYATVASTELVQDVDTVQFGVAEGPCFSSVRTGRIIHAGALRGDTRWPRFGPGVARLGVSSAMSLPLGLDGRLLGAINIYVRRRNAVNYRAVAVGRSFSVPAASFLQAAIDSAGLAEQPTTPQPAGPLDP